VLSRLPWSTSSSKDDPRGVALGMELSCAHIPFLREYLECVKRLSPGVTPVEYDHHIRASHPHEPDATTYAFLMLRYGLTHADLTEFVDLLDCATELGTVLNWTHLERVVAIDE